MADDHEPRLRKRLRDAAIEAEYETGVREDTVEEARASIHVRVLRITAGSIVLVVGVLLLALPGPGWLTIAAGLAILSRDVKWAERLLDRVRERIPEDEDGNISTRVIVISFVALLASAAATVWWYFIR